MTADHIATPQSTSKATQRMWRVAVLCGVIAMLDGFDTQALAFVAPVLGKLWGVDPRAFGAIFAVGLFGLMVGQATLGPLSDRIGRKPVIIGCTILFALGSLATALATNVPALVVLRFITGIGLGGATPSIIAMTSDFAPPERRATIVSLMFGGFPLGAAIGGYISSHLIPAFGWESVFIFGGVIPLAILPLLFFMLPGAAPEGARPGASAAGHSPDIGWKALLAPKRRTTTIILWIAYFNSLLMVYFLMSWMPSVAQKSGLALDTAIHSAVALNIGGAIGGFALGRLADRKSPFQTLAWNYGVAALAIAATGLFAGSAAALIVFVFVAGLCTIGGQTAMNATNAIMHPIELRGAALGAALAIGRAGSIVGPFVGGWLIAANLPLAWVFALVAVPAVVVLVCVLALERTWRAGARMMQEVRPG